MLASGRRFGSGKFRGWGYHLGLFGSVCFCWSPLTQSCASAEAFDLLRGRLLRPVPPGQGPQAPKVAPAWPCRGNPFKWQTREMSGVARNSCKRVLTYESGPISSRGNGQYSPWHCPHFTEVGLFPFRPIGDKLNQSP